MAGYTKADYDNNYSIRLRIWDESIQAYRRSPVRLGYHRAVMANIVQAPWPELISELGITSSDRVIVVGAGYGWGVEKLIELTGCVAVGTDISDYIQETQDYDEEAEIKTCIVKAGFDPKFGHGKEVLEYAMSDGFPKASYYILNEGMDSTASRKSVTDELGGQPTLIITEDMLSDLSDIETVLLSDNLKRFKCRVCHFTRERGRTSEETQSLTKQIVIAVGSMSRVG